MELFGLRYILVKKMAASQESCTFLKIFNVLDFICQEGTLTFHFEKKL